MEEACLNLANHLISLCKAPLPQTCSLNDIDSDFFTLIFEKICHMPLPDLLAYPKNFEEKAHNVQVVIDTLSLDLLAISLSHITGEDVVARNVHSIYNLLEVIEGVVLFNPIATAMEDVHWERENAEQLQTVRPYTQQRFSAIDVKSTAMNADVEGCNCCGYHYRANTAKMATEKYLLLEHISDDENIQVNMPCIKSDYGTKSTSVHLESDKKELKLENERQNQPLEPLIRIKYHSDSSNFQSGQVTYDFLEKGLIQEDAIDECIIKVPINRSSKNRSRVTINESSSSRTPQASRKTEKNYNSDKLSRQKPIPKKAIKAKYEKNMRILIPGTKKKNVADLYRKNLEMKLEKFPEICHKQNQIASQLEKAYLQAINNKSRKSPICRKSYLLPAYLRRSQSHAICNKCLTEPATSQKNKGKKREKSIETAFLKELKDEFSGVYMSSGTGKKMKDKYQKQLLTVHRTVKDIIQKKSRTQLQTEEVVKKQKILSDILKRQIEHQKYVKEQNEYKHLHTVVQASFREARCQSSRTRNYYNEYHTEMKKKMQKRNYSEEALLKNAFEECLDLQKEQIHLLCQQAKEHQERDALHHKIYLDALDNYYQSQFSLLAESLAIENHNLEKKTKSQRQVLSKLKQNFRSQMIRNIRNLQENLSRDKEETHFRELDAERYKDRLRDTFSVHLSKNNI